MRPIIIILTVAAFFASCNHDLITPDDTASEDIFFDPDNLKILIVGGLTWQDPYLESFDTYHRKDAELEQTFLNMGVAPENIIALYDQETTLENIYAAFDSIAAMSDENTHFVFYFSGHGFPGYNYINDHESIYFANYDISSWYPESTGFNIDYIGDTFINVFKGNSVLFMADCCQSGGLVEQAQKFGDRGIKASAITSCAAANWSTGNWTFTQKIIDGLNGDAYENLDGDGAITFSEMIAEVDASMKNNERQKSAAAFFNWDAEETVVKTNHSMKTFSDDKFHAGQYVFAKHKHNYYPVQIIGKKNDNIQVRFYDYADYEDWTISPDSIKIPYYVQYPLGDVVDIESNKPKTASIEEAVDGFYKVVEVGGTSTLWLTYERLSDGSEQAASVQDEDGNWVSGKVLATEAGMYYVTYDDKGYQWDEWVTSDKVAF